MAVSYSNNRVTVTAYKTGSTTAASANTVPITSGAVSTSDVGRFIACVRDATNSKFTEVRKITSVSSTSVGLSEPWTSAMPSGATWIVSHNLDDVHAIGNSNLQKIGKKTYRWNGDWDIQSNGFLADEDITLEMRLTNGVSCPMANGSIIQFGYLWGGEFEGTETTNGCRLYFDIIGTSIQLYSSENTRFADGFIANYYGCLLESSASDISSWTGFQRMNGPVRFVGCLSDGVMGGRFYHEGSQWLQCRMSGNISEVAAWSIGATFDRSISDIFSYRNVAAMKSYKNFGGTLRNVTFSNNNLIFLSQADAFSVINFIDCTEFDSSKNDGDRGEHNFFRSVVLNTTDSTGVALLGVKVRINNKNDVTQGSIQESNASGRLNEILCLRFRREHNSFTYNSFFPFRIRYRKYGYLWQSLNTAIADPIKQSTAVLVDSNVTQTSTTAQGHTGITVTDHGASPVSWNGKNWGITVVGNLTTNSALTLNDIEHYLHYNLSQDVAFAGKSSGLEWHNFIPIGSNETQIGEYAATIKGVRVVDENGSPFPGVTRMQADDSSYYVPPVTVTLTVSGFEIGSDVIIYDSSVASTGTGSNVIQTYDNTTGTSVGYVYTFAAGTFVDVGVFKPGKVPVLIKNFELSDVNSTFPVTQTTDRNYV